MRPSGGVQRLGAALTAAMTVALLCAAVELGTQLAWLGLRGFVTSPAYPWSVAGLTLLAAIGVALPASLTRRPVASALALWVFADALAFSGADLARGIVLAFGMAATTYAALRWVPRDEHAFAAIPVATALCASLGIVPEVLDAAVDLTSGAAIVTAHVLLLVPLLAIARGPSASLVARVAPGAALLAIGLAAAPFVTPAPETRPALPAAREDVGPNLVVLVLDTVRADHLSLYGYERDTAPGLARFVKSHPRSALFPRAYSTSNWTIPAHASLLSGQLPSDHGAHYGNGKGLLRSRRLRWVMLEFEDTLAERLRERGYRTGAFLANHFLFRGIGLDHGFDLWVRPEPSRAAGHVGEALRHEFVPSLHARTGRDMTEASTINREVLQFLDGCPNGGCFVLANYMEAHTPYAPSRPFAGRFSGDPDAELPTRLRARHSPDERRRAIAGYDEELLSLDAALAELLDALEARGQLERSWIVITSDHGEAFGEHGAVFHSSSVYDEQVRIPLLIHPPRGTSLPVHDGPVGLLDLTSTLAMIGTGDPMGPGRDLREAELPPGPVQVEFFGWKGGRKWAGPLASQPARAVVLGDWKLIAYGNRRELYQLSEDPGESNNLSRVSPGPLLELASELPPLRSRPGLLRTVTVPSSIRDVRTAEDPLRALGYVE